MGLGDLPIDLPASSTSSQGVHNTHRQFFFRSMTIGVLVRATLISAVYKRALSLTVEARAAHPNGQLTTLVSSDVGVACRGLEADKQISRIDYCAQCKLSRATELGLG